MIDRHPFQELCHTLRRATKLYTHSCRLEHSKFTEVTGRNVVVTSSLIWSLTSGVRERVFGSRNACSGRRIVG